MKDFDFYKNRLLSEGYPDLAKMGGEYSQEHISDQSQLASILPGLRRLVDFSTGLKTVVVIGCGPKPWTVKQLLEMGFDAVGLEPEYDKVLAAEEFLGEPKRIIQGCAESLPFENNSQRVILMENVLEHVDSPTLSLSEAYRVLVPGGVLYIYTNNRLRFSLTGFNGDFRTRFFNWFPAIVRECYVFHHLHYDPRLANFSPRPAVHWFTYGDLCKIGRQAGFAKFYSKLDLAEADDQFIKKRFLGRWLIQVVKYRPWLKALALVQFGNAIFMLKRKE